MTDRGFRSLFDRMKDPGSATQFSTRKSPEYFQVTVVYDISEPRIGFPNILDEASEKRRH
jgi:hypothetical protein